MLRNALKKMMNRMLYRAYISWQAERKRLKDANVRRFDMMKGV